MENRTQSEAAQARWSNMTPQEKAEQTARMKEGRKKSQRKKRVTGKKAKGPEFMELVGQTRELLVLAGSREQLQSLIDVAEHAIRVEETIRT